MRLTVIGCSGSFPGPDGPASCYLVEAPYAGGTFRLLLDLGNGALGPLQRHAPLDGINALVISHLHPDHFIYLDPLLHYIRYDIEHPRRVAVHGPAGNHGRLDALNDEIVDRAALLHQPQAQLTAQHIQQLR